MKPFFFDANNGRFWLTDLEGTSLNDAAAARAHAVTIIRELMRNDAPKTRHWRLRVRDAEQNVVSEMTFAAVEADSDEGLRRMAGAFAALNATIQETEHLVRQMDSMLSRAERKPYLAAVRGRCVID